jgi:hypothetical protein
MRGLKCVVSGVALVLLAAWIHAAGVTGSTRSEPAEPDFAIILKGYKTWPRVNSSPFRMSPAVAAACAAPTAGVSPHTTPDAYIDVYVNPVGRETMFSPAPIKFPEGTIIVKEKRKAGGGSDPELLTVMLKRSKGFNAETGDWDFAVLDGKAAAVQAQGKLENCMQCHKTVASSDYVFRPYVSAQR